MFWERHGQKPTFTMPDGTTYGYTDNENNQITLVIPDQTQRACDQPPEAGPPEAVVEQCQQNREIIATGNPWTDPSFWFGGIDKWHLSDIHAIRALPGNDVLEHIHGIIDPGPGFFSSISPDELAQYFPENHPMLCCCK